MKMKPWFNLSSKAGVYGCLLIIAPHEYGVLVEIFSSRYWTVNLLGTENFVPANVMIKPSRSFIIATFVL